MWLGTIVSIIIFLKTLLLYGSRFRLPCVAARHRGPGAVLYGEYLLNNNYTLVIRGRQRDTF